MPGSLTSIEECAFNECKGLTGNLTLPEGLKSIGNFAFSDCEGFTGSLTLPEDLTSIGDFAFSGCTNISKVTVLNARCLFESYSLPKNAIIYGYKDSTAQAYAGRYGQTFIAINPIAVPVTVPRDASADDVLSNLDLGTLLNKASLAGEKISGPTLTIAGKTFSVFSVDASVKLDFGDLQAKVDTEEKTIQVLAGFDKFSGSAKLDQSENSSAYWSKSYQQVKSLYTGITGKKVDTTQLWNNFSKLRGRLKKMNCSMGIDASASIAGYIEFSYASGEIVYTEGGMVLEAALGTSVDYKLPPCPAVYVTFGLKAGFDGKIELIRESTMNYTPSIAAGIDLEAALGVTAGSKKVKTYAELGLKGNLKIDLTLPAARLANALAAELTATVHFDSKVFGFDGPNYGPQKFASYKIYPRDSRARALFGGVDLAEFDWDSAKPSDRSYLAAARVKSAGFYNLPGAESFVKSNLYRYNAPQMAVLDDGSKLLVWIDDNGEKSAVNKTSLMYSVYDGNTWSKEAALAETGGSNDYPVLFSDGRTVRLVWQKAEKLTDQDTLPTLLESVELYTATYKNGVFGEPRRITSDNTAYEMMQSVAGNGDSYTVAWVENTENNPFQSEGKNCIKIKTCAGGTWQEEQILMEGAEEVYGLRVVYVENIPVIIYETSGEDVSTIHMIKGTQTVTLPGCGFDVENGTLYYNSGSELVAYDLAAGTQETVLHANISDCTVLDDGIHKVILATVYHGYTSELAAYQFDRGTGTWSNGIVLTDRGKYIRDYSAVMQADGTVSAAVNFVEVDEDSEKIYGNAELCVIDFGETEDLTIGEGAYYDEKLIAPGATLPLYFHVTNNGWKAVEKFRAEILDESGAVLQSGEVLCRIAPGDSAEASLHYKIPSSVQNQKLAIRIYTENETDCSDNEAQVEIGMADIALSGLYLKGSETDMVLKGIVRNLGYKDAQDVEVTAYNQNTEGNVIGKAEIGSLQKRESREFEVTVPQEYLNMNPLSSGNILHVTAASNMDELDYVNNTVRYLIKPSSDEPIALNYRSLTMRPEETEQLQIVYSNGADLSGSDVQWESSDDSVVLVENGKLTAVSSGKAEITATAGSYQAACSVLVLSGVPVGGVYLNEMSVIVLSGDEKQLTAHVLPENAANQNVTWESDAPSVAVVSQDGIVTGVGAGTAVVTVYTEDGYKSASCRVTVSEPEPEPQSYTAEFAGGEGAAGAEPAAFTCRAGESFTLPENTFQKEGMLFAGWSDSTGSYQPGESYEMPAHHVLFTALWASRSYTVTFDTHGHGSAPEKLTDISPGEKINEPKPPTEEGYLFTGWYKDASCTEKWDFAKDVVQSDIILYAGWKDKEPDIVLPGWGDLTIEDQKLYKTPEDVPDGLWAAGIPDRTDYTGKAITFDIRVYSHKKLLTEKTDYTISYKDNTDAADKEQPPVNAGTYILRVSPADKDQGHGAAKEYPFTIAKAGLKITAEDITVRVGDALPEKYACRTEGLLGNDMLKAEPSVTCTVENTSVAGEYRLIPSNADAGANYDIDYVEGKLTIVAGPEEKTYTVTFHMNGHGAAPEKYTAVKAGDTIKEPTVPTEDGYVFTGWYKDSACMISWDFSKDTINADTTLYAGWIPESEYKGILPEDTLAAGSRDGFWVAVIKEQTYTRKAVKPQVHVYDQEKRLEEGWDYTLTYKNNIKAADASAVKAPRVTVKGKSGYGGIYPVTFTIKKAVLDESHLAYTPVYPKGRVYTPAVIKDDVLLKAKTDYVLTYENNDTHKITKKVPTKEGSYTIHVSGKGSCEGEFSVPYTVIPGDAGISITRAKAVVPAMAYRGALPTPTLTISKTGALKEGTDYTVRYANTGAKGTATAIFTGIGDYSGVLKKTFKVKAAPIADKDVTVAKSAPYRKGGAKPEISVIIDGVKLTMGINYTVSYKNNKKTGRTATVTIKGKGNYGGKVSRTFQVTQE